MKTKIGDNIIPILSIVLLGYVVLSVIKNKSFPTTNNNVDADHIQYSNRLIEFFEKDNIADVYNQYNKYVDMGISAKNAFLMLTENGLDNDN